MTRRLMLAALALVVMAPAPVPFARMVIDINTTVSGANSFPSNLTELDGIAYFGADDGANGSELWRSDGTTDGTWLVQDIYPASASNPGPFAKVGGVLVFPASDPRGRHVWRSDGTAAGTALLKEFVTSPFSLVSVGGVAFFAADAGGTGAELWKTAGTQIVKDVNPGVASSFPGSFTAALGKLFFQASDGPSGNELWSSDGTEGGTARIRDINPGAAASNPSAITVVGGTMFLSAASSHGRELWITDDTEAGTVEVRDINTGAGSGASSTLFPFGKSVLFVGDDGVNGSELWRSDGTARGTQMVKDILPGAASASIGPMTLLGNAVFFRACSGPSSLNDCELWKTDGTGSGTVRVKDINPGVANSLPDGLTAVGGTLFFSAVVTEGTTLQRRLWKSDGTEAGTMQVSDTVSSPSNLVQLDGVLYFVAASPVGTELWRSDGTAEGTFVVKDIRPGPLSSSPQNLFAGVGLLFFNASDGISGRELWRSDGTPEGTLLVQDSTPGPGGSGSIRSNTTGPCTTSQLRPKQDSSCGGLTERRKERFSSRTSIQAPRAPFRRISRL
jgi:trimeric autotransporter adhesin